MGRAIKISSGDCEGFLSETSPIGPRPCQPCPHSLGDSGPLKLGDRGQDMHLQFAGWRGRVDALVQRDERDTQYLEFVEQRDQVLERPTEPIQPSADQHVEPAPLGVLDQGIESGTTIRAAGDAPLQRTPWWSNREH